MKLSDKIEQLIKSSKTDSYFKLFDILYNYDKLTHDLFSRLDNIKIEEIDNIPDSDKIPFSDPRKWLKVKNVSCLFIDIANSSILDYKTHPKSVAQIYQGFTNTLVEIMNIFKAKYIDIKGDGAFALFDQQNSSIYAFLAAVSFRTFFINSLRDLILKKTNNKVELKFKGGIYYGDVIFKRMGLWGDKKNEVWTNSTVNNCFKLTSKAQNNSIIVSEEVYNNFNNSRYILKTCGCGSNGIPENLWTYKDDFNIDLNYIGIEGAWEFQSWWCKKCGEKFINLVIKEFNLDIL